MLKLMLFGSPQLVVDGEDRTAQITGKHLALLTYLAVTGQTHRRDMLATLLWRDMSDGSARKHLSNVLSDLRKQLEPYLTITRLEISFNQKSPHELDVARFQARLAIAHRQNSVRILEEALDTYRGDLMQGVHVRNAPGFDDWILYQRELFHGQAIQAFYQLAEQYVAQGNFRAGLAATDRWLTVSPGSEEAHRARMQLLANMGQRSAALLQFSLCRQAIENEFGVLPSVTTTALYEQIRSGAYEQESHLSYPRFSIHNNLPVAISSFVGRSDELGDIHRSLTNPACRLLTISGIGGVGKTSLALEAARRWITDSPNLELFRDGIYCFSSKANVSLSTQLNSWLDQILNDPMIQPSAEVEDMIRAVGSPQHKTIAQLKEKSLLLIIDDVTPMVNEGTQLTDLLYQLPGLKFLVISRQPINIVGEWLLLLRGLPTPPESAKDPYSQSAVELFLNRSLQLSRSYRPTTRDLRAIARICRLVDGLPLGIELAADWLPILNTEAIAQATEARLDWLATSGRKQSARHQTLVGVLDEAWTSCTDDEKALIQKLHLLDQPFHLQDSPNPIRALSIMSSLINKTLLEVRPGSIYSLNPLFYRYLSAYIL